jgi:hypothetical protein
LRNIGKKHGKKSKTTEKNRLDADKSILSKRKDPHHYGAFVVVFKLLLVFVFVVVLIVGR